MLWFSHIAWPLGQVTKGNGKEKFVWAKSQQKVFEELKHYIFSTLILSLSNLQQPFEIELDVLEYVVGTVLTQHGHPMEYDSDTLSYVAHKYPTYDNDMYSIVKVYQQ